MNATPAIDLSLEIRSEDGSCAVFFQEQKDSVKSTLHLLGTPRLFAQPLLVLASPRSLSAIPCRAIDMILASTSAPILLRWPAGFLDIAEVPGHDSAADTAERKIMDGDSAEPANITTSQMHIYTLGGWVVTLRIQAEAHSEVHDQRLLLARFLELPALPFRLAAGGIGFINPAKISRVSTRLLVASENAPP